MTHLAISSVAISTSPEVLENIRDPDCNLSIWEREALQGIAGLLDSEPRDVRLSTSVQELPAQLRLAMAASGFEMSHAASKLIADVDQLAGRYAKTLGLDELEVRLEIVTTDSCRKWHADYVKARLITTYVGTGTQWLDERAAEQVKAGQDPQQIGQMGTGDVGLFKGKLATNSPAIHRSPPISDTGEVRLLLVLNPVEQD